MALEVSSLAHSPGHVTRFLLNDRMFEWSNQLSGKGTQHARCCFVRKWASW